MLKELSPILIASPVHRSGTTLLQRLLCSASNTLVFGETLANDMNFYASMLHNKQLLLGGQDDWRAQQMEKVLQGDVNDWIPDILPDKNWVLTRFEAAFHQVLSGFAEYAVQHGRPLWGAKLPAWSPGLLQLMVRYLPKSRVVYIVRDLASCVRSAKLIGYCQGAAAVRQYAQMWQTYQRDVARAIPKEHILYIDYQQLCAEPTPIIADIEAFTGAHSIDQSVMQHRINNYNRIRELPPELTEEEFNIIQPFQEAAIAAAGMVNH